MKKTVLAGIIITALLLIFTMGCSQPEGDIYTDKVEVEGQDEAEVARAYLLEKGLLEG